MMWNNEASCGFPALPGLLSFIVLFASLLSAPIETPAQESPPTDAETTWLIHRPQSNTAPHLVIGMQGPWGFPAYRSLRHVEEGTSFSPSDGISRPANRAVSGNRNEKEPSHPPVLSSLLTPAGAGRSLAIFPARPAIAPATIQTSADLTGTKAFSVLDGMSASESLLNADQANYLPLRQWPADSESFASKGAASAPLLQLEFGGWKLPVTLSITAVSR